jgi:hypothetical protein
MDSLGRARNVSFELEEQTNKSRGRLVLVIDLDKDLGPSKSNKTTIVGSTGGALTLEDYGMPDLRVNVNVYDVGNKPGKRAVVKRRGE